MGKRVCAAAACVLLFCAALNLTGCDFLKRKFGGATPESAPKVEVAPAAGLSQPPPACKPDSQVETVSGVCKGNWGIGEKDGAKICEFTYAGQVQCPEGMGSFDGAVACAGSYRKKVGVGQVVEKNSDCATHFGESPKAAAYELKCCN